MARSTPTRSTSARPRTTGAPPDRSSRREVAPSRVPGLVVLASSLWLSVAWAVLGYGDAERAVAVDVAAAVALLGLSTLRLLAWSASRGVPVLVMGTGLALVIAPVVLRYGYTDRVVPAFVNDMAVGLVVLAAGWWLSRQGPHGREEHG